jgi:HK97 family phage major capsid protein
MRKELRDILAWLDGYNKKSTEERTPELRAEAQQKMAQAEELEEMIAEEEKIKKLQSRNLETTNSKTPASSSNATTTIEIPDNPVYRSRFPLGEQLRDIYTIQTNGENAAEARNRWESMVKREEHRAAGVGMVEAVGQDGGLLLQGETSVDLMTKGFNNSQVLRRTSSRTTMSQFVDIIEVDEDSMAEGSRQGGIRVYTDKELALITSSKTKFRKLRIEPKRLTGLYHASLEILRDVPMLEGEMSAMFTKEFARKKQYQCIRGTGSGEALGILNSDAIVTVAKETGQSAGTIVRNNLTKMMSRVYFDNMPAIAWFINQDTLPELTKLTVDVGTGGNATNDFIMRADPANGSLGTLFGFPVIPLEQCSTLGTVGDIFIADFSEYITADKGGIDAASSIHVKFEYAQSTFRFLHWFDGQPRWRTALTPENGTNTVAPTVVLATRA